MVHALVSLGNIYGLGKGLFSLGYVELLVNQGTFIEKDFGPPYPPLKIEQNSISPHRGKI